MKRSLKQHLTEWGNSIVRDETAADAPGRFAAVIRAILFTAYPGFQVTARRFLGPIPEFLTVKETVAEEIQEKVRFLGEERLREFLAEDDPFGRLYEILFSKKTRLAKGEFFTPAPLARYLADKAAVTPDDFVLDPACGSGVFLLAVRDRWRKTGMPDRQILSQLAGFDLNPLAVLTARAQLAVRMFADPEFSPDAFPNGPLPIYHFDSLTAAADGLRENETGDRTKTEFSDPPTRTGFPWTRPADVLIGNPPWIHWDKLPHAERRRTESLWKSYGLFNLSGFQARMGGGKKEWAGLFLYAVCDRFLKSGGMAAMLIPLTLLKSGLSGEGFRRLRIEPGGENLGLTEIDDFSESSPFPSVATPVGAILLRKGTATVWPIPVIRWKKIVRGASPALDEVVTGFMGKPVHRRRELAEPSDPERPESALRFYVPAVRTASAILETDDRSLSSVPISDSPTPYTARLGVNTAGANGVFWVEKVATAEDGVAPLFLKTFPRAKMSLDDESPAKSADSEMVPPFASKTNLAAEEMSNLIAVRNLADAGKKPTPVVSAFVESELLFPLVRWRDVTPFRAQPSAFILLTQDPATRRGIDPEIMAVRYPNTLRYLSSFRPLLEERAAYRKLQTRAPYWSLYNVSSATLAPVKVIWRRMDSELRAAVLLTDDDRRPILPQETLSMIAVETLEEADYLAAVLNDPSTRSRAHAVGLGGTKGFGSPGLLPLLKIPQFDPDNPQHRQLSEFGKMKREYGQNE